MQNQSLIQPEVIDVGTMKYGACLELQHSLHSDVSEEKRGGALIFVEHEPVITFGKNADPNFLHFSKAYLEAKGIDLFDTDRGGEITAHMPGQLVVYPILSLPAYGLGARDYINVLEQTVIAIVADYGVVAATHKEYPGVWVDERKVCAVGVRIKNRTSMHGIAFNICNNLDLFDLMTPCGIKGKSVCSLSQLVPNEISVDEIKKKFPVQFMKQLAHRKRAHV
jgi:lipoyl(octanoyl) transferase